MMRLFYSLPWSGQRVGGEPLEGSLKLLPKYRGTTFRDLNAELPTDVIEQFKVGTIMTDTGFVSTSTEPTVPLVFKPETIVIDDTFSGRQLDLASSFGIREREVLFTPNRQWRVLKVVEGPDLTYFGVPVKRIVFRQEIPVTGA
ncbi:MAG: hypothetical protein ABIN08_03925 [Caldimonas sp.]